MIALASTVAAGSVRLPTGGYVRPGRYFPVQVRADAATTLAIDGCVPTDVAAGVRGFVPVLAVTMPTGDLAGTPLRTPADGERLVAATTALPPAAVDLFPTDRLLPVRLDPADPLPGPPAAWELLDAVVLDGPATASLSDARRSALLAGGVVLATPDHPTDGWPWTRRGRLWVLSIAPAGPTAGVVQPDVYGPTESWTPRWPARVRWTAVTIAVGVSGLTTVLVYVAVRPHPNRRQGSMSPGPAPAATRTNPDRIRRLPFIAAVGVPLASSAGVLAWRSTVDPVARASTAVTVTSPAWSQRDDWVYERARAATATERVAWAGWTHPAFPSPAAAARARLAVSADGRLAFTFPMAAGTAMAFVRRDVRPAAGLPPVTDGHGAAVRDLASSVYLSVGDRVAGETPADSPDAWPGVAITRP